jgi:magnesium transporter
MTEPPSAPAPEELERLVESRDAKATAAAVRALPAEDTPYVLARLDEDTRVSLFELLAEEDAVLAAAVLGQLADEQAGDVIDALTASAAARIVDRMKSDVQADVLAQLDDEDRDEVLAAMSPSEAQDVRERMEYEPDTAGGLMITEFLAYPITRSVTEVIDDLRAHGDAFSHYEVGYVYGTDEEGRLVGVVPMRRLLMASHGRRLADLVVGNPVCVTVDEHLDALEGVIDRVPYRALPVLDKRGELVGVLQRASIRAATADAQAANLQTFAGIIGGVELRSMPTHLRTIRRLAFLLPSILLSFLAVSVIGFYEPLIDRVTALAVFLPLVANLSGAAGNQAVAVSIRELSLGLIRPADVFRVGGKEALLGVANGVVLAGVLAGVVFLSRGETPLLAVAVGGAFVATSVLAVVLGGVLPLVLSRLGVDPAMLSSPILTTLTDVASFLAVLGLASLLL